MGITSRGPWYLVAAFAALAVSGCGGSDGAIGTGGLTARIAVAVEPAGANCAGGGSKITAGVDANADGVLDPSEVASTQYVCNGSAAAAGLSGAAGAVGPTGAAGFDALVAMLAEPAGANCAAGGRRIDVGPDRNRNGVLDAAEIASTGYVCNGASGSGNAMASLLAIVAEPAGANCAYGGSRIVSGVDGNGNGVLDAGEVASTGYVCKSVATLVAVDAEAAGPNCPAGGSRITAGLDANANGTLDNVEIANTQYVCDGGTGAAGAAGQPGVAGANGRNALVTLTAEPAGGNCAAGGRKISVGLDGNGNGVLDAAEVTSFSYVCNGGNGGNGAAGAAGAPGTNGVASLIAIVMEPAGVNCVAGGSRVTSGLDLDGNGVLDAAEVSATAYVCNGLAGTGVTWFDVIGSSVQALPNSGYVTHDATSTTVTLPPNPGFGDVVRVTGLGYGTWTIAQNAGQRILTQSLQTGIGNAWLPHDAVRQWSGLAASSDGRRQVAVENGGQIYTSTDAGSTWTARESNRGWTAVASSADGTRLVAVDGAPGRIYTSTDSGLNWTPRDSTRRWSAVTSSADGSALAATESAGSIYLSNDSGATWTVPPDNRTTFCVPSPFPPFTLGCSVIGQPPPPIQDWSGIAASANGMTLVAVARNGVPYRSGDGGTTWFPDLGLSLDFRAVAISADGSKKIAAVDSGQLYVDWVAVESNRSWSAVAASANGSRLFATDFGGRLYVSLDAGATWVARDQNRSWRAIAASADGVRVAAAGSATQIYVSPTYSTQPGTAGTLTAGQFDAVELVYVGSGLFNVLSHEGGPFVAP